MPETKFSLKCFDKYTDVTHLLHLLLGECLGQLDHLPLGDVAVLVLVIQLECHLCLVLLVWRRRRLLCSTPAKQIMRNKRCLGLL